MKTVLSLILIGAGSRLITLPHGLSLTVAMILLAAAYLDWRRTIIVALGTMILGDTLTGFHSMIPWTWTGVVLMAQVAWTLFRGKITYPRMAMVSIVSLTVYHLWSNFGIWVMGSCLPEERVYPMTLAGLTAVYQAGWSYYLYSIGGNLAITTAAFIVAKKTFGLSAVRSQKAEAVVKI